MNNHTPSHSTSGPTNTPSPSPPAPRALPPGMLVLLLLIALTAMGVGWIVRSYVIQPSANQVKNAIEVVNSIADDPEVDSQSLSQVRKALTRLEEEVTPQADFYTCGMHPWVILPKPGICPICHMTLTPIDPDKFTGEITIDPVVVQNMGVRIAAVTTGPLVKTIRSVGTVDYDETRVRDVNIKAPGWIEKLHVDYLGAPVKQGEPLFEFYSPELYSTQQDHLLNLAGVSKIGADFLPEAAQDAKQRVQDTRVRLLNYDITAKQIEQLETVGKPSKTMTMLSPHHGVVIDKHANEGMKVDQGMRVYRIADLSKIWVIVTLYEYQLPYLQTGQRAVMTLPYIPGQSFEGEVIFIYPYLEAKTREVQVRLEFDNFDGLLKPGMFTNVELHNTLAAERTLAPRSAVIDTGKRQIAFVSLGEGKFEPRDVRLGVETDDGLVEIQDGLKPGDMVVVSGQFLIDSEAKMREALMKMIKGAPASEQEAAVDSTGASELTTLPAAVVEALEQVLDGAFAINDQLASDSVENIDVSSRQIAQAVDALLQAAIPDHPHFWHQHTEAAVIRGKALALIGEQDLAAARLKFADLNLALSKLIRATGVPKTYSKKVLELHCPMFREGQSGSLWIQPAGDVRNPYMGSIMLECFDQRLTLPVTGAEAPVDNEGGQP